MDEIEMLTAERRRMELAAKRLIRPGLSVAETEELNELSRVLVEARKAKYRKAGVPERYIGVDGRPTAPSKVCRGCWRHVADGTRYVVQWTVRGLGYRWHLGHAPASLAVPEITQPRIIGNTRVRPAYDWPDDCLIQGGDSGVVFGPDGTYRTAFFEAFPTDPQTFLRGEAGTLEEAETDCWQQYQRILECENAPEHGPWDRNGYMNGAGWCLNCGLFDPHHYTETGKDREEVETT